MRIQAITQPPTQGFTSSRELCAAAAVCVKVYFIPFTVEFLSQASRLFVECFLFDPLTFFPPPPSQCSLENNRNFSFPCRSNARAQASSDPAGFFATEAEAAKFVHTF